jgi:predicted transcriptional regulator
MDKIDPNFYENPEHKQEVKQVIIQTLEDLYDEIEELEEEEEDYDDEDYLIEDEE